MYKKLLALNLLLGLLLTSTLSHADFVGLRITGGVVDFEIDGTLRDSNSVVDQVNLNSDLHIADKSDTQVVAYIEHPIPGIPNFRVGSTTMNLSGTGQSTINFSFNGQAFTTVQNLTTTLDLSHTELAIYYEIIDIGIDLDLGLNVKFFDGNASITNGTDTASTPLDGPIPMLYASLTIPFPGTGFSIVGDISSIAVDDSEVTDTLIRLRYETDFNFGVEAGIRNFTLDYEDTTAATYANIDVSGPFVNLYLFF